MLSRCLRQIKKLESKVCKECSKIYHAGTGSGYEYMEHMHGKNHPMYGKEGCKGPFTEIHRKKLSMVKRGKNYGVVGKNHPMYGRKHNADSKKKIGKGVSGKNNGMYGMKGKLSPMYERIGDKNHMYGRKASEETKAKMRKNHMLGAYDNADLGSSLSGYRKDLKHLVRSKWEANFARVLKFLGIKYSYEKFKFDTPFGIYTPDFYIVGREYFVEVKGYERTNIQRKKRNYIRDNCGVIVKMVRYRDYIKMKNIFCHKIDRWEK